MLVLEGQTVAQVIKTWVAHAATWSHGVIWSQNVAIIHVWVRESTAARVWVYVHGSYLSKAKRIPGVWAATWVNVGFWSHAATRTMPIWVICSAN